MNKEISVTEKIEMAYREGIIEGARRKESMERELYGWLKKIRDWWDDDTAMNTDELFLEFKQFLKKYEDSLK